MITYGRSKGLSSLSFSQPWKTRVFGPKKTISSTAIIAKAELISFTWDAVVLTCAKSRHDGFEESTIQVEGETGNSI